MERAGGLIKGGGVEGGTFQKGALLKKIKYLLNIKLNYIHLFSVILFAFRSVPWLFKYTPSMGQIFYVMHRQR